MLNFSPNLRIFLAIDPTDMRKSFDGLFALVENVINENPLSGHLFLFRNRKRDRVKLLYWDQDGLVIWYKRLEEGSYQFPSDLVSSNQAGADTQADPPSSQEIRADELAMLLGGIDLRSITRRRRYQRNTK
jgi:hypothetical protein